jgi:rare lipoprotein A
VRTGTPKRPIKISQGVLMAFRLNAAICGAVMTLAFSSVAVAQSEIDAVHSNDLVIAASGATIIGAASTYNPYRPGYREGGLNTASGGAL